MWAGGTSQSSFWDEEEDDFNMGKENECMLQE